MCHYAPVSPCVQVAGSGLLVSILMTPALGSCRHAALFNIHILSVFVNLRTVHGARGRDTMPSHEEENIRYYSYFRLSSIVNLSLPNKLHFFFILKSLIIAEN